jgi:lauroyl/myristoyl acyltransferase
MRNDNKETPDLDEALAAARRRLEAPAMPPADLRTVLRTSPALRRLLPTRLAVHRAVTRAEKRWDHSPSERRQAMQAMEAVVGGTAREPELEQLARQHVIEEAVHRTLFWQPWRVTSIDPAAWERFQAAASQRRGVLISACHLGPIFLYISPISSSGHVVFVVSAPWFFAEPSHDEWGRRLARWWKALQARDERIIYSVGAFPVMRTLLQEGEIVLSYLDMPGSRRTDFLGKPVMLSSTTARLATQADAPIVAMRARREGYRVWTDVAEPLDPRDFSSERELHDALAAVHERWILELPATFEDPNRAGAWEGRASRSGWLLPERSQSRPPAPAATRTG